MIQNIVTIDGSAGGQADLQHNFPWSQIAFSGRTSGLITVDVLAYGGEDFEPFDPPLTIDLSLGSYTRIIPSAGLSVLRFVPDSPGDEFVVTILQSKNIGLL